MVKERFQLTKDGVVTIEDKMLKHPNHRENYINKMKREGYDVLSLDEEHDARNVSAYIQVQEEMMFDNMNRRVGI
jgi:hypothetical protein